MTEKLVLSGVGVVFPGGRGPRALAEALRAGTPPAARTLEKDLKPLVPRKGLSALSRSALLGAAAIENLAAECAGLLPEEAPGECGLVVGTAFGHVESKADFHHAAVTEGVGLVSPIVFPNTLINSIAGHAAILFGLTGPNSTVCSGRRSGIEAILRAATLIRAGRARRAIVVGCDEVSPSLRRALEAGRREKLVEEDVHGLGEAACALLVEPEASARGAGRSPLAVVAGWGERNRVGLSLPEAIESAARGAVAASGLAPGAIGWIAASRGGGARAGEEAAALSSAAPRAALVDLKAFFGETFAGSGVLACAAAVALGFAPGVPSWLVAGGGVARGPVLVSAVEDDGATALVLAPPGA
jgi:3-oxoacyl-[acyl-carrier-protein] synthase II